MRAIQDTLALIGNASAYISQARRQGIVEKLRADRPQLATFMKEVCKGELTEPSKELFGQELKQRLNERADTIKSFDKALTMLDPPKPRNGRFLARGSSARYSSNSGRGGSALYNTNT